MTMTSYTLLYNQSVLNLIRGLLRKGGIQQIPVWLYTLFTTGSHPTGQCSGVRMAPYFDCHARKFVSPETLFQNRHLPENVYVASMEKS